MNQSWIRQPLVILGYLHHEKLRHEGWDTFWTDNQLPYLTPH